MGDFFGSKPNLFGFENKFKVDVDFSLATWNTVASHEVFTVTGLVRALLIYRVTEALADAGGTITISFGDEGSATRYTAALAKAVFATAGSFIASAGSTVTTNWGVYSHNNGAGLSWDRLIEGYDLGYTIAGEAATDGAIEAWCFWSPISVGASVVAGAGGAL